MKTIQKNYVINENTLALLPAMQMEYDTIVVEKDKKLKVRKTPFQLIEAACFNDWCTYEGRRQAVIWHTNFKKKTPIPINSSKIMYFFPTHAQDSMYNSWIAFHHIATVTEMKTGKTTPPTTIITFTNGTTISVDIKSKRLEIKCNGRLSVSIEWKWEGNGMKRKWNCRSIYVIIIFTSNTFLKINLPLQDSALKKGADE